MKDNSNTNSSSWAKKRRQVKLTVWEHLLDPKKPFFFSHLHSQVTRFYSANTTNSSVFLQYSASLHDKTTEPWFFCRDNLPSLSCLDEYYYFARICLLNQLCLVCYINHICHFLIVVKIYLIWLWMYFLNYACKLKARKVISALNQNKSPDSFKYVYPWTSNYWGY